MNNMYLLTIMLYIFSAILILGALTLGISMLSSRMSLSQLTFSQEQLEHRGQDNDSPHAPITSESVDNLSSTTTDGAQQAANFEPKITYTHERTLNTKPCSADMLFIKLWEETVGATGSDPQIDNHTLDSDFMDAFHKDNSSEEMKDFYRK